MKTEEFLRAKKRLEGIQKKTERSRGVLSHLKRSLQEEFGCSSIEEAETMLQDFESKTDTLEKEAESKIERFLKKWGDI